MRLVMSAECGEQKVKGLLNHPTAAENIFKLQLTHHNLISELVRHFSCEGKRLGERERTPGSVCAHSMQKI